MKNVAEKPADAPTPNRKKRILVVEDETPGRLFLLNQLKKAGLELDTAANGTIAVRKLKDTYYDAMILDLMLVDIKGQDLVKQIRKHEPWNHIKIFACTSPQRPDPWRGRAVKNGVTKLFDKGSCSVEDVVAEIVALLAPNSKEPVRADTVDPSSVAALRRVEEKPDTAKTTPVATPKPPEIPSAITDTGFTLSVAFSGTPKAPGSPVLRSSTAPVLRSSTAEGGQTSFTPLPTGREATSASKPAATATPASPETAAAQQGKTGFFHNPTPPRTTDTSLLRKAAKAGQASIQAAAQAAQPVLRSSTAEGGHPPAPVPAITGDTPLNIPPISEAPPPVPKPPAVAAAVEPEPAAKERPGFTERIIAPFKLFSSRAGGDTAKRLHELEEQLAEVTRNRDELLGLLRDQPIFGTAAEAGGKSEAVNEAKAAATRAEAAYQAELARSKQFEDELKRIREARDELNRKLAQEEKAAAESRKRSKELEERLVQSASELDQVKGELQKNIGEHSKLEGELRQQLNSTRQSADIAKVAYQEEAARAERSTEELVTLQQAREQLNSRLTSEMQAAAESKHRSEERERQLREKEAEVERLKNELARGSAQSQLKEKLTHAQAAAQTAEAAYKEEAARGAQFEQELKRLKQASDDLNTKLSREEQAAAEARRRSEEMERQLAAKTAELDRVKGDLDRHAEERKTLETQLQQQIAAANDAAEKARRAFSEETSVFRRSKEEVDALRQARDQLNTQLEHEQQAAAESRRHSQELEGKLQASAQELTHLRAELEKHVNERAALVTASSRQLTAAKAAAAKAEKAYQDQLKRSAKYEKELATLRQDRTQLGGKLKTELKSTANSKRKIKDLEKSAADHAGELEKARKALEKQLSERERLESEHRKAAEASQHAQASDASSDPGSAEARFRESISALARATAQLEKEKGERRRVEQRASFLSGQLENLHEELRKQLEVEKETQQRISEYEHHLREREEALAKAVSDLQKETAARQLVEAQLKANGDMDDQMQEQFNFLDEAKRVFSGAQKKLEARLEDALASNKQTQARLQKQSSERKRLETSLEEAQRKLHEQSQHSATEVARLQAALQVEVIARRKLESQSMQTRYASVDASRLGKAFVNSFRTHLRPSAEHLLQACRGLLELPLSDDHKKLVEQLLEDALFLQTSMQDDARLPGESDAEHAKAA